MKKDQLENMMSWIESMIILKIEQSMGRDSLYESIRESECRDDLLKSFGETE